MIRILNLGAGVQSSVLLLMSARGELAKIDHAIFADTQWEPPAVYAHLDWLTEQAGRAGIPVHRVTKGNIRSDMLRAMVRGYDKEKGTRWASMPVYTITSGRIGQLKRQCTHEYKIEPIEKFIKRELLGLPKWGRAPFRSVEQWFGISKDEMRRVRVSRDAWKVNRYPLIFDCDPPLDRAACVRWFQERYPGRSLPWSSCIGCPYHRNAEWREIKNDPALWSDVIQFDESIRKCGGMRGETFIHSSARPLKDADLSSAEENGQLRLFDDCAGVCGV